MRSLQHCGLWRLLERYREAEAPDECTYILPTNISWQDVDCDHVVSAGQVFNLEDIGLNKLAMLRRCGVQAIRQGKVGVVLLAGGANHRFGYGGEAAPPIGCNRSLPRLQSRKSILQLLCERIVRMGTLCAKAEEQRTPAVKASIPVLVMTSKLTHKRVVEQFEACGHFGLCPQDVVFFEQPVGPLLSEAGRLLPQSLGGEFAQAPGGPGAVLAAMAASSALEQMRDRGVDCLHIVGTDNLLAKACDPSFIGFCRDLEIDCACKLIERHDPAEDIELFAIRQSKVSSFYADVEESACGLAPGEAPSNLLTSRDADGTLECLGAMHSYYMTISFVEEVVGRPQRARRVSRVVPYLDFVTGAPVAEGATGAAIGRPQGAALSGAVVERAPAGVAVGSWPTETPSTSLACQRGLMAAAAEVRAICGANAVDGGQGCQCDVHLDRGGAGRLYASRTSPRRSLSARFGRVRFEDPNGPRAVVRVGSATLGCASAKGTKSICELSVSEWAAACDGSRNEVGPLLSCSLVVPSTPNAYILETSVLDYFLFTDRAVGLHVSRSSEFAPIRDTRGLHTPEIGRKTMIARHHAWVLNAGFEIAESASKEHYVEVSPLLSYDGEGLGVALESTASPAGSKIIMPPCHLKAPGEADSTQAEDRSTSPTRRQADDLADGLDTRPFYLQEYPRRPAISSSNAPRFNGGPGGRTNSRNHPPLVVDRAAARPKDALAQAGAARGLVAGVGAAMAGM